MKKKNCKKNNQFSNNEKKTKKNITQSKVCIENLEFNKTCKQPKHLKKSSQIFEMINQLNSDMIRQNRAMENMLNSIRCHNKTTRSNHKIKQSKSGIKIRQLVSEQKNILKSLSKTKNRFYLTIQC